MSKPRRWTIVLGLLAAAAVPLVVGAILTGGTPTEVRGARYDRGVWTTCAAGPSEIAHPEAWTASADCTTYSPDGAAPAIAVAFHQGTYEDIVPTAEPDSRTRVGDGDDPPSTMLDAEEGPEAESPRVRRQEWVETPEAVVQLTLFEREGDMAEVERVFDEMVRRLRDSSTSADD